jgi:hypothetical protein
MLWGLPSTPIVRSPKMPKVYEYHTERIDRLREQAEEATRKAHERAEHCTDWQVVAIAYPWVVRPAELPLSYYEIGIALQLANGDFETAGVLLKVSTDRLRRAIKGTPFARFGRIQRDKSYPPVEIIPRNNGLELTIRIANSTYEINARIDEDDFLIIDLNRKIDAARQVRLRNIVEKAQEIGGRE